MTLAVDRAAVEILGKQVCVSPGIDHITLRIEFYDGRRRLSGVQLVIGQTFQVAVHPSDIIHSLNDEHMILGIDADAPHFPGYTTLGQGFRPIGIDFIVGHIILGFGWLRTKYCERDCQPRANPCLANMCGHVISSRQYVAPAFTVCGKSQFKAAFSSTSLTKSAVSRGIVRSGESSCAHTYGLVSLPDSGAGPSGLRW